MGTAESGWPGGVCFFRESPLGAGSRVPVFFEPCGAIGCPESMRSLAGARGPADRAATANGDDGTLIAEWRVWQRCSPSGGNISSRMTYASLGQHLHTHHAHNRDKQKNKTADLVPLEDVAGHVAERAAAEQELGAVTTAVSVDVDSL